MVLEQHNQFFPEPNQEWARFREIGVYGISLQGSSHVTKGIPCQDNNGFCYLEPEGILVAAVADGVGSCERSHWGAAAAVGASLSAISKQLRTLSGEKPLSLLDLSEEAVEKLFHNAFRFALKKISQLAQKQGCDEMLYQTTLTAAIYDGSRLACCHIGDGGIVAQGVSGNYRMITERIKGDEASSVVPLQSGRWQITRISTEISGFLMATDGVLDYYVSGKALGNRVYYPFFEDLIYGMSPQPDMHEKEPIEKTFHKTCTYFCSEDCSKNITDDMTVLAVANQKLLQTGIHPQFSREDWEKESQRFLEEKKKKLYPGGLGKKDLPNSPKDSKQSENSDSAEQTVWHFLQRRRQKPAAPAPQKSPGRSRNTLLPKTEDVKASEPVEAGESADDVDFVCIRCGLRIIANRKKHPLKIHGNCPYCGGRLKQKRRPLR